MSIFLFLRTLFRAPTFAPGERVNHIRRGSIHRTDGYVVAQGQAGVLVEWPRGGASVIPVSELAVIG